MSKAQPAAPVLGSGAFQWNWGGWLGAQLGSTLWILVLGVVLAVKVGGLGWALMALGLAPNLLGVMLWRRRAVVPPYPAIQALILACGLAATAAWLTLRGVDLPEASWDLGSGGVLLVYPGLMLMFHVLERANQRR